MTEGSLSGLILGAHGRSRLPAAGTISNSPTSCGHLRAHRRLAAIPAALAMLVLVGCTAIDPLQPREIVAVHDGQPVLVQMPPAGRPAPPGGWPVMLFLHGLGERGTNIDRTRLRNTPPGAYPVLRQLHDHAILVTPQMKPDWRVWDVDWVRAALDTALDGLPADRSRLVVTGLSVGGNATWAFVTRYPQEVAAAVSFAGVAPESIVDPLVRPLRFRDDVPLLTREQRSNPALATTPFLAVHCTDDAFIPYDQAERMIEALRSVGNTVADILAVPDCAHASWPNYYLATATLAAAPGQTVYAWLLDRAPVHADQD